MPSATATNLLMRRAAARVVGLAALLALCACAAAHTPAKGTTHAGQSDAGAAVGSAGHTAATGSGKPAASAAGTKTNDGGPSPSDAGPSASDGAAFAACGIDDAVHDESTGPPCAERPATACDPSTSAVGQNTLRRFLESLLTECSVGLIENSLHVAFVRGCATHVSLARMQPSGTDPPSLACLAARLGQQRLTCIEQYQGDCVEYMVSTLAAQ